jgi:alpha-L-rhamnosidase
MSRPWPLAAAWLGLGAALVPAEQAPPAAASDVVDVVGLTVDAMAEPLGIDNPKPRLAWRLHSARRGVLQTDYRVRVASRPEWIRQGTGDLWDSGNVRSADPFAVYDGRPLKPRTRYYWSVRVATTGAHGGGSSSRGWFETALLDPADWKGAWIAGPERSLVERTPEEGLASDAALRAAGEFCRPTAWPTVPLMTRVPKDQGECREVRPTPMLRKAFTVDKPVARARVHASGLGYLELTINGARASGRVLDPQFTDYSKTVLYTTDDVTSLLREGANVIAAELGSGKFDDAARTWDWGWHKAQWRATPRLRLDLYVTYTDGTELLVRSDESWKVSVDGPTRYDSTYLGETYDARREIRGWKEAGFDDRGWAAARVVPGPAGVLRAQAAEPTRVVAEWPPGTRTEPAPRVSVYDVGQNMSGWATVRVRAPAGTAVEIFYSEILEGGRASTKGNGLVGGQLQTDYYVARGGGEERWTPRFSYKGFQYVQVSGPGGSALPEGASAEVESVQQVWGGLRRTSTFTSSHPLLDRIHAHTDWAVQENNVAGITTDTPIYEKNAWTGDAQLTAGTFSTLYDTERLYRKQVQDMLDAQTAEGEVPHLAPSNVNYGYLGKPAFKPVDCCGATPPWDAFWFVVPSEGYRRHGDVRLIEAAYPAMRKYLDEWVPRWTGKDGDALAYTLTSGLGDWCAPKGVDPVISLSATAYYAHFARLSAEAARALGKTADAARDDALFARIRDDFNAKYLGTDGVYREKPGAPFAQTAQILPLAFGLVPEARRKPLLARLADDITNARGGHEYVGVLGARYILPVLLAGGYPDVAFTVATRTDYPSYGYWAELGWTSLGEFWEDTSRSRSHHFFGSIVQSFYEDLAGLRALEAGYRKIEVRPAIPAGLDHVAVRYDSVRGPVATSWRKTASGLRLDVTVPPTATAEIHVPAAARALVREGGRPAEQAEGVRFARMAEGRPVYLVGSGEYHFEVPAGSGAARQGGAR